jgi:hypothetical protein
MDGLGKKMMLRCEKRVKFVSATRKRRDGRRRRERKVEDNRQEPEDMESCQRSVNECSFKPWQQLSVAEGGREMMEKKMNLMKCQYL